MPSRSERQTGAAHGRPWARGKLGLTLACVAFAVLVAELLAWDATLAGINNQYTDLYYRLAGKRHAARHTALVVVDDEVLNQYKDDPLVFWSPQFAATLETLNKLDAKAVGVDFLFATSPENWLRKIGVATDATATYDLPLRQQINAGKVVLVAASIDTPNGHELMVPHQDYLLAVPDFDFQSHLGLADVISDKDGAVRRFAMSPVLKLAVDLPPESIPTMALGPAVALLASDQRPGSASWQFGGREVSPSDRFRIAYSGPPGSIPAVSMAQLLRPGAESDPALQFLKGKAVILGGRFHGMNDWHHTPYSSGTWAAGSFMAGAEIQANAVETLLAGTWDDELSAPQRFLTEAAIFTVAAAAFLRLVPWQGFALLLVAGALLAAGGYALFLSHIVAAIADAQAGLIATFLAAYGARFRQEERERARIKKIFGRYVSDTVVDVLLDAEKLPDLGGETTQITVLFSDIRNFTTISERLSAHEVVTMLNTYFDSICDPIHDEGGCIDKYIGDAIMVEFGSPVPQPDHALRACRTALRMLEKARQFNEWMRARHGDKDLPEFNIGIGIHTGEAVVGNIGSKKRMEYTAIGDTVNTASRLEGMTKSLECAILASRATVTAAGREVITGKSETVQVKGREQAVEVIEIVGISKGDPESEDSYSAVRGSCADAVRSAGLDHR